MGMWIGELSGKDLSSICVDSIQSAGDVDRQKRQRKGGFMELGHFPSLVLDINSSSLTFGLQDLHHSPLGSQPFELGLWITPSSLVLRWWDLGWAKGLQIIDGLSWDLASIITWANSPSKSSVIYLNVCLSTCWFCLSVEPWHHLMLYMNIIWNLICASLMWILHGS
jgi:hypothetical protein